MSFDRLRALRQIKPYLVHEHGYSASDIVVLYAIAEMENQTARQNTAKKIEENGGPKNFDPSKMVSTWCKKSALTLALENGLSESQVQKSIAKAALHGVILVRRMGANVATRRAINPEALRLISQRYERCNFKDECAEHIQRPRNRVACEMHFAWLRYFTSGEISQVSIESAWREGFDKDWDYLIPVPNLLEATKIIEKLKDSFSLRVDLRRDKNNMIVPCVVHADASGDNAESESHRKSEDKDAKSGAAFQTCADPEAAIQAERGLDTYLEPYSNDAPEPEDVYAPEISAPTLVVAPGAEFQAPRKLLPSLPKVYASSGGVAEPIVSVAIRKPEPQYEYEPETRPERQYTDWEIDEFLGCVVERSIDHLDFVKNDDSPFTRLAISILKRRAEFSEANFDVGHLKKINESLWRIRVRHIVSSGEDEIDKIGENSEFEDEFEVGFGNGPEAWVLQSSTPTFKTQDTPRAESLAMHQRLRESAGNDAPSALPDVSSVPVGRFTPKREPQSSPIEDSWMAALLAAVTIEKPGKLYFRRGCPMQDIWDTMDQFKRVAEGKYYFGKKDLRDDGSHIWEVLLGSEPERADDFLAEPVDEFPEPVKPLVRRTPPSDEIYSDDI